MTIIHPDKRGYFGDFGGRFVPETLMPILFKLEQNYIEFKKDQKIQNQLKYLLKEYAGRPTPLYFADSLSAYCGGPCIYLKREDLLHTGAHKINNTIGQVLLAEFLGKDRIIAETGAGQHGVATASVAAKFGKECVVYMGEEDMRRQEMNVFKMRLLGAEVVPVLSGTRTLKDATSEAIRDWVTNAESSYYLIGSTVGPHPYPLMVRDFQSIIGMETIEQIKENRIKNLSLITACVGGGSNALGMFYPFLENDVNLMGFEASGFGIPSGKHAATLSAGRPGILHGSLSYLLQDENGQVHPPHSISAGLDYPGVGPEHSFLKNSGRVEYQSVTDAEAIEAFKLLTEKEGIIPALESSHAVAGTLRNIENMSSEESIIINLSGRGDKDLAHVQDYLKETK